MITRTRDLVPPGRRFSLQLRRIAVAIAGFSVLALGLVLVVVPVPGTSLVVIPLGFTILAKEFAWARCTLAWATRKLQPLWFAVRQMFRWRLVPAHQRSAHRSRRHPPTLALTNALRLHFRVVAG
jgi:hypothetical protein